jgi:hypothetical protein
LTNATGLPISTGVSGLGTGVATFLATPSSANLATAVTDETGSGALVFATSPTLVTPALGTPSALVLTNATALPAAQITTGTIDLARMTTATAYQTLAVNSAGTAIVGGWPTQQSALSSDATPPASLTTLSFTAATITSGKIYRYRIRLLARASSGSPTITIGNFATGGSASASSHKRTTLRLGGTVGSSYADDSSFSTSPAAIAQASGNPYDNICDGVIVCNGTGTITPATTPSAATVTIYAGSTFEVWEVA